MSSRMSDEFEEDAFDYEHYGDDDLVAEGCYNCGGRHWLVTCIDDMCHGLGECVHGDDPTPCPVCNPNGDIFEGFF